MSNLRQILEEHGPNFVLDDHRPVSFRLGRHVEHDEASKQFPAERAPSLVSVEHVRASGPFNQGDLGSCTGNAMAGVLDTLPWKHHSLGERTAVKLYELATTLDGIPGEYPPTDTGSSGLAVCKAAQKLGYISRYSHAFGLQHALEALVIAPVIMGIAWYDSFDNPPDTGILAITPGASVRGGHELEVSKLDVENKLIGGWQSWGDWGPLHGRWLMSWDTFGELLDQQGDVTVPVP